MTEPLSWFAILFIVGAGQGVFLALSLLSSQLGSHAANRYLAALTLAISISLVDSFLALTGLNDKYIQLTILLWPKEFFYGVLIYFYVRELTRMPSDNIPGKQWLHFVPAFIHVAITWSMLLTTSDVQLRIFADEVPSEDNYELLLWLFFAAFETLASMVQILIYLSLSFRLLYRHSQQIKQRFSSIERINLHWLTGLLIGLLSIYLIWVIGVFVPESEQGVEFFATSMSVSMVALIYAMGYFGLRQPQIFVVKSQDSLEIPTKNQLHKEDIVEAEPVKKYKNSPLDEELSSVIVDEITHYMATERPYLDSSISLPQLAEKLGLSVHYLSQTINEQFKHNFFDFINSYRIEEAKRRLASAECQKHSILTIAMDAGFNSKSSFYNAFKKHMEMTPSQYRKSLLEQTKEPH